jgi:hypothetical protein
MVKYPSDEHDEVQDENDDAVGNSYAGAIRVGVGQEAYLIVEFGSGEISESCQ